MSTLAIQIVRSPVHGSCLPTTRRLLRVASHPNSPPGPQGLRGLGVGGRTFLFPMATRISVAFPEAEADEPDGWEELAVIHNVLLWLATWGWAIVLCALAFGAGILCFGAADKACGLVLRCPSMLRPCCWPIQALTSLLCR